MAAASGTRFGVIAVGDATESVTAVDPLLDANFVDRAVVAGSLEDLGLDGIAIHEEVAESKALDVGDPITVRFAETGEQQLRVAAVYADKDLAGSYLLGQPLYEANFSDQFDINVLVQLADDIDPATARAAVDAVAGDYPTAEVRTQSGYADAQAAQVDQILNLIYVLLALAVFIALMGIANTLGLSILERTRELGLLRAVGMTRRQVRSAVRYESVIIALLGTVLGLGIGLFFGWAMVTALADEGIDLVVPGGQLAVVAVIAALAGVVAAILPARRAAHLNVLDAIATT